MSSPLLYLAAVSLTIRGAAATICRDNRGYVVKCPDNTTNIIIGTVIGIAVAIGGILVCGWKRHNKKKLARTHLPTHNSNTTPLPLQPRPMNQRVNSVGEVPPAYSPASPTRPLPAHNRQDEAMPTPMYSPPLGESAFREEGGAFRMPMPMPRPYIEPSGTTPESHPSNTNPFRV